MGESCDGFNLCSIKEKNELDYYQMVRKESLVVDIIKICVPLLHCYIVMAIVHTRPLTHCPSNVNHIHYLLPSGYSPTSTN